MTIALRPSASKMWTACSAMPRFTAMLPNAPSSDPAREGTCAAWVAEVVLTGEAQCAADLIGRTHDNGWLVEADMAELVQGYIDHLRVRGGRIFAENKVVLNNMIEGTPDAFAVLDETGTLYVDGLKFGYDIVDPYRNTQVGIYAGAIIRALVKYETVVKKVVIGIYQPRAFHPQGIYRTWEVWPEQLMEFVHWVEDRGNACQDIRSTATPGFHCEHCPAAGRCTAITNAIYKGFRVLTDENQLKLSGEQMGRELTFLDLMEKLTKARKTMMRAEAAARMNGAVAEYIPGWGFEPSQGNRRFHASAFEVKVRTGIDPYVDPKLCSPAEMIRRGADKDVVNSMSSRASIPPKLSKLDENKHLKIFGDRMKK